MPVNHPARAILADNAIDDDGDIILRRVQSADGRTRVFVNDQPASVALMRDIGRALVEIHGQHDERALVEPAAHRDLLDAFGGHVGLADGVAESWKRWRGADQELAQPPGQGRGGGARGGISARLGGRARKARSAAGRGDRAFRAARRR